MRTLQEITDSVNSRISEKIITGLDTQQKIDDYIHGLRVTEAKNYLIDTHDIVAEIGEKKLIGEDVTAMLAASADVFAQRVIARQIIRGEIP